MPPLSFKLLKSVALLIFIVTAMLVVTSQVVTVASRKIQVRDKQGQVIGEAWVPHDYGTDPFLSISLMALSGMQLWTILNLEKAVCGKKCKEKDEAAN